MRYSDEHVFQCHWMHAPPAHNQPQAAVQDCCTSYSVLLVHREQQRQYALHSCILQPGMLFLAVHCCAPHVCIYPTRLSSCTRDACASKCMLEEPPSQAIGATTPAITAAMAYFMLNTRETRQTYMTLVPVVLGIIVASGWEPNFNMLGFLLCLTATTTRSFKTVLQALLLSDPAEKLSSMSLMYYMSPMALGVSLPLVLMMEDAPWLRAAALMRSNPNFAWAFVANVLLSYCINLTNFLATQYTSALTIQVGL